MTGPHDGVIGMDKEGVIARFVTALPGRYETATGDLRLHAVSIVIDEARGGATAIERISLTEDQLQEITDTVSAARA
jgi:calcineurin-like phosphoesterase